MIDEPGKRRVDRNWIDDRGSVGRMKNIGRRVGSGPWPGAMRTEDLFEVTEVLNLISFKKDSSGRSAAGERAGESVMTEDEQEEVKSCNPIARINVGPLFFT